MVGDVITDVSGIFGDDVESVVGEDGGLEEVRRRVKGRIGERDKELKIRVLRGSGVKERHDRGFEDMVKGRVNEEREGTGGVEDIVSMLNGGWYDDTEDENEDVEGGETKECGIVWGDDDTEDMIDKIWVDCTGEGEGGESDDGEVSELKEEAEVKELTEEEEYQLWKSGSLSQGGNNGGGKEEEGDDKEKREGGGGTKPWDRRSSGSGTFIRNPETGKMERW